MDIKTTGKTDGKSNKLGGGGRFQQMLNQGKSPALAAFIGRKLYGNKKMADLSRKGKKDAEKEDNERDNGKLETKMHERSESKKKEESED